MSKKEKNNGFDVNKVLTEDFDDFVEISEKEERRQKWKSRRKK
jgi:hypothetical protein